MIKWFAYIVLLLILMPCLSFANIKLSHHDDLPENYAICLTPSKESFTDTTLNKSAKQKQHELDEKKKIKEVAKAKRLSKPEKVDEAGNSTSQTKVKPKRQRRPAGLERPPEIPRRNGN
jgi:hypothetical protein